MVDTTSLTTIRAKIDEKGLKIKHLANVIGVSSGTLSMFLNGKRNLGLAARKSLLRELGISDLVLKVS